MAAIYKIAAISVTITLFALLLKMDFSAEQGKKRRLASGKSSIFDKASALKDALRVISSL